MDLDGMVGYSVEVEGHGAACMGSWWVCTQCSTVGIWGGFLYMPYLPPLPNVGIATPPKETDSTGQLEVTVLNLV
jgi:hypothetical protein